MHELVITNQSKPNPKNFTKTQKPKKFPKKKEENPGLNA